MVPLPDKLADILLSMKRKIYHITKDGNCLFRALSFQLSGNESAHSLLRDYIVRFENLNANCFKDFLMDTNQPDIASHVNKLMLPGEWGTQIEIIAAATLFQVPVLLLTSSKQWHWESVKPLRPIDSFRVPVLLNTDHQLKIPNHFEFLYFANYHFDAIVSLDNECVCSIPPIIAPFTCGDVIAL